MLPAPVCFYLKYDALTPEMRPVILHEYAVHGAKYISLTASLVGAIMGEPEIMKTVQKELADEGLTFLDSHAVSPREIDLNCEDAMQRRHMIAMHKLNLWIAAEMGVNAMAFHPGFDFVLKEFSIEKQIDLISASLDELLPEAEQAGVTFCLENIWFAGCAPKVLLELKKRYPTPYFAFCYDSGHAHLLASGTKALEGGYARGSWKQSGFDEPEWEDDALEKMLPYVVNCHLHDNHGIWDEHLCPGLGTIDWKHIITLLRKAPNLRAIQSEVGPTTTQGVIEICKAYDELGRL